MNFRLHLKTILTGFILIIIPFGICHSSSAPKMLSIKIDSDSDVSERRNYGVEQNTKCSSRKPDDLAYKDMKPEYILTTTIARDSRTEVAGSKRLRPGLSGMVKITLELNQTAKSKITIPIEHHGTAEIPKDYRFGSMYKQNVKNVVFQAGEKKKYLFASINGYREWASDAVISFCPDAQNVKCIDCQVRLLIDPHY